MGLLMQQSRNLIITMVLCVVILGGWFWLENQFWPRKPPQKKDKGPVAAKVWPKLTGERKTEVVVAGLAADNAPLGSGGDGFRLFAHLGATIHPTMPLLVKPPPRPVRWQNFSTDEKQVVAGASSVSAA